MSITYTPESKFPLMDNGSGNWGAVINGVFTQLDKGVELTLVAGETIVANDVIYIAADGKGWIADADNVTKRPAIGIASTGATATGSFKVRTLGWFDYDDTAHGGALAATAGNYIYLSNTVGQLTVTPYGTYPQVIGIAKTSTAANITRILLWPQIQVFPFSYDGTTWSLTGKLDIDYTNIVVGGANCLRVNIIQATDPLTGTLRAGYFVVTNGPFASTGTIRGIEIKARAATSGLVGGNITTLEGASIDADAKNKTVVTLRGAEIIMDGQSGAAITLAVGLRISNNFQANIATTSYGLQIYKDSFDYTADIQLSSGGLIGGSTGHLKIDSSGLITITGRSTINQINTSGAIPVLTVNQTDVSEELIRFIGSSANGILTQSVVKAADVSVATLAGYIKMYVQDDGDQLTDQAYFMPIYTLA